MNVCESRVASHMEGKTSVMELCFLSLSDTSNVTVFTFGQHVIIFIIWSDIQRRSSSGEITLKHVKV